MKDNSYSKMHSSAEDIALEANHTAFATYLKTCRLIDTHANPSTIGPVKSSCPFHLPLDSIPQHIIRSYYNVQQLSMEVQALSSGG